MFIGEEVLLKSLQFEDGFSMGMGGMMGGMMGGGQQQAPNGTAFDIYSFKITAQKGPHKDLLSALSKPGRLDVSSSVNAGNPRRFFFSFSQMQWVINGETFGMTEVADWERVKLNTTEVWEFINGSSGREGGRGMGMMRNYEVMA